MEKENFFTKLRRVATSTASETARLKASMEKPAGMRSSNADDSSSAKLVLKEIKYDAMKMKESVNRQLNDVRTAFASFDEIVNACDSLCEIKQQQVNALEEYLQQYGYERYGGIDKHEDKKIAKRDESKENVPPGTSQPVITEEQDSFSSQGNVARSLSPGTPLQTPSAAPPCDHNKTPQLADFGISQWTMDRLAVMGLEGQTATAGALNGSQYGSLPPPSAMSNHPYPLVTPTSSKLRASQQQQQQQCTPFMNSTILVTPGMFGDQAFPTETPTRFLDKNSYLDSPIPPVLMSEVKKKVTSDLKVTGRHGIQMASLESECPTLTASRQRTGMPAPPLQHHLSQAASVTPPTPASLAPDLSHQKEPTPTEPSILAQRFAPTQPSEPVQLARQHGDHASATPTEPATPRQTPLGATTDNQRSGYSAFPVSDPSVRSFTTPKTQRLISLDSDMPATPELTMTYKRYLDVTAPVPPAARNHGDLSQPSSDPSVPQTATRESIISPVNDAEFSQIMDYLQRLLPIAVINDNLAHLNRVLAAKQDTDFITNDEMDSLQLGSKTKAFTLLLAKLNRLQKSREPGTDQQVFYVVK